MIKLQWLNFYFLSIVKIILNIEIWILIYIVNIDIIKISSILHCYFPFISTSIFKSGYNWNVSGSLCSRKIGVKIFTTHRRHSIDRCSISLAIVSIERHLRWRTGRQPLVHKSYERSRKIDRGKRNKREFEQRSVKEYWQVLSTPLGSC